MRTKTNNNARIKNQDCKTKPKNVQLLSKSLSSFFCLDAKETKNQDSTFFTVNQRFIS